MFTNKKIHLIGIGGVSMSSIALMLLNMGCSVTGSDINKSNLTKQVEDKGGIVKYGHHKEMIKNADIVVYTAAIKEDDIERIEAKRLNKKCYERAEFLGILMKEFRVCLCVSGTHGKSTTTGMLSQIFISSNLEPTVNVGAILPKINSNCYLGKNDYFIMEACEYVDSFLKFFPTSAIITNIDNDHLDYFKNLDNIKKSFYKYVSKLPENGFLVKNNDDENSSNLEKYTKACVITYGINNESLYMAKNIEVNDLGFYSYDIYYDNKYLTRINLSINGYHNIYNSLSSFALAYNYIKDIKVIKTAIEEYHGVKRRFEFLGKYNGALIYDDYAHHPSEIRTTLESVKAIKHNTSWVIFQSHTYSRTKEHLNEFASVLSNFDKVIIAPIFPAREINTFNISEDMLVDEIRSKNNNVCYIDNFDDIVAFLKENVKENDLVISVGAGPINEVTKKLVS